MQSRTNRELILSLIPNDDVGISIEELEEQTGFDHWKIFACIWLLSGQLWPLHNPFEIRWTRKIPTVLTV